MPAARRGPGRAFRGTGLYGGSPLTLPQATTLPATAVEATSAVLNGSVNPDGLPATYWFAWGTTPQYGNVTASVSAGSGTDPLSVAAALTGLATATTYHFAVVAQSAAGTVYGSDTLFVAAEPIVPVATTPLVPIGTGIGQPHFDYPFMITNAGASVVEQDSLGDVFACVRAIVACPAGACAEIPGIGIPDPTFGNAPVDPAPIVSAIQNQEPRATQEALVQAIGDPMGGSWQVALTSQVASDNGALG